MPGTWGSHSSELPPGDSSPPPHALVVFTQFFCFPSFLLSQTAGVAGVPGGVSGGWLAFVAFQNPRLSLAHLSFSFTTFSAPGSGCISRKSSPWLGSSVQQVESSSLLAPHRPSPSCSPVVAPTTVVSSFAEAVGRRAEKGGRLVAGWGTQGTPGQSCGLCAGGGLGGAKLRIPLSHSLIHLCRGLLRCMKASPHL